MLFFGVFLLNQFSFNCHKCSYALLAKCVGSPPVPNGLGSVKLFIMAYSLKQRYLRDISGRKRKAVFRKSLLLPGQHTEAVCHYNLSERADSTVDGEV